MTVNQEIQKKKKKKKKQELLKKGIGKIEKIGIILKNEFFRIKVMYLKQKKKIKRRIRGRIRRKIRIRIRKRTSQKIYRIY